MSNDNTLGAPTEGLGQTVTFAVNGSGGVPQTQATQRGAVQNNSTGGGAVRTAQALQVQAARQDPTFEALAKLGGAMLQPYIEQERTAKYMEGMQKASQGQAITEIVDEQPWYSKLFGSTSLVDGARAWTASTKATGIAVDIETNMAELRKLPAADFAKYATDRMMQARTGDGATDMMITQQVGAILPVVMKAQAKAFIEYKTEVAGQALADHFSTNFSLLQVNDSQVRAGNGTKEGNDLLGAGISVLDAMKPVATMPIKSFNHILTQSIVKSIAGGNFALANLLENSDRVSALSAEEQGAIRAATIKARTDARLDLPPEFGILGNELSRLARNAKTTDAELAAAFEAANARYTKVTGDPAKLFTNTQLWSSLNQLDTEREQEARANAVAARTYQKAADKEQEAQNEARMTGGMLVTNQLIPDSVPAKQVQAGWVAAGISAGNNPVKLAALNRARVFHNGYKIQDENFKNGFNASLSNAVTALDAPGMYSVYAQQYLPLVTAADGNQTAALSYIINPEQRDLMATYHRLAQAIPVGADPRNMSVLLERARAMSAAPVAVDKEFRKKVAKAVNGLDSFFDKGSMAVKDVDGLTDYLLRNHIVHGAEVDQAVAVAIATNPALTIVGGSFWEKHPRGSKLDSWLTDQKQTSFKPTGTKPNFLPTSKVNSATAGAFSEAAKKFGIEGEYTVFQEADKELPPDAKGNAQTEPVFMLISKDPLKLRIGYVSGNDIKKYHDHDSAGTKIPTTPMTAEGVMYQQQFNDKMKRTLNGQGGLPKYLRPGS